MLLDDLDLSKQPAVKRARAGLARSFQSLELFEDSTVFENLSVAADPQDLRSYLIDLVWPINPPLPPEVVRAVTEFDLDQDLHRDVQDLSYGKRRLLAIARAVAMHPSVLLLDEPAAGLSSNESSELARVVRRLADEWGMAIVVVEHDMNFVMGVCDRVGGPRLRDADRVGHTRRRALRSSGRSPRISATTATTLRTPTAHRHAPAAGVGRGWCVMTAALLETRNLKAGYLGREVVRAVNLKVQRGEVVCLLGPNGAGKSTTLLTIAGELAPVDGIVMFNNVPTFTAMDRRVRDGGIGLITEERLVFTKMSARDNLRLGGGSVEGRARAVPRARTAAVGAGRAALGRRAADVGPRPGPEPEPVAAARRRAVARARTQDRRPASRRGPDRGRRTWHRGADRRAARPQGVEVRRPDVPDGARADPARALRRRGAPAPRRDRGCLPARHLRDRGGPHRAAAAEEQEEAVEAPAGSGARTGTSDRADRVHQEGRR